ncbi:ATP-binding protein [Streptomyces melanogenes]|uniref:ATP-binding protein n=1 Tax=Streptomyces melanogenes TaxID=67326 RepID=UPI001996FD34|nr:NB-ARC domain-containing protein [Streptomyces melanogenes]GGP32112.1 NTPase [Streptomyces melanogenes]
MDAELTALAASGATSLVGLMVTDSWGQAKERLARFLARRRGGADGTDGTRAAGDAEDELAAVRGVPDARALADLEDRWSQRLLRILREDPGAAVELRRLLDELAPAQPHSTRPEVRPFQVPALTVAFVNRTADLSALDRCFGSGGTRAAAPVGIGVLHGLPGVGKTATACHWADRARELYPDGQMYVDFASLRAGTGGDVSEAVAMCLRSLGVSDDWMPRSLAERTALFRSHSAERRMLVVLDDVSHPAQVRPLVPKGPGSAVLVTSHGKLGELVLDGARLISLDPLDGDGGMRLLADRCGEDAVTAERAAAERLVELCGGLPVALHVVAARLLTDRRLTMTGLADELADEAGRLAGMSMRGERQVSAVLGPSYRTLRPDAARLYRLLGWAPVSAFDTTTAAVAAGIDVPHAAELLEVLETASLLEGSPDGRYRLHDLVRLHARECAEREEADGERAALTRRVVTHYLALTALADRAIRADRLRIADLSGPLADIPDPFASPGGPVPLEWLEAERTNILQVLRAAVQEQLHEVVWQLAEAFTVLFLHHRHLAMWRESLELGAAAAAADLMPAAEARLRSLLSRPLLDLGEDDRARAELEAAVSCAEIADHIVLRASVQEFLGRYWDRADPARAIEAYRRSLALNRRAGEARGAAIAAYFLGCAQDAHGDHADALTTLTRARDELLGCSDARMAARATAALGTVHDHLGDTQEALRALREAARTLHEQDATHYEAQALVRLADITERSGAPRSAARPYLVRALEIHEAGGSPEAQGLRERLDGD